MRLEPLYRVTFRYPEHWHTELEGRNGLESAHFSGDERYRWLNDVVCPLAGEVRAQSEPGATEIVLDVAELVWEEIP